MISVAKLKTMSKTNLKKMRKINLEFSKYAKPNLLSYPLDKKQLANLKKCRLVNPKVGKSHGYKIPKRFNLIASTNEIVQVRLEVEENKFPMWFMQKYYLFKAKYGKYVFPKEIAAIEGLSMANPKGLADVVHMDSPSDMPRMVLKWLTHRAYKQNQNVRNWTPIYINFLETIPFVEEQISDGVKRSLIKAFEMKYEFGLARPEEIWGHINNEDGTRLTAYKEGCPNHPSFPAGHASAAAGGLTSLIKEFPNLTDKQMKRILDMGYSWAMFRSLAGVHHAVDNIAGLMANGFRKYMKKNIVKEYKV